MWVWLENEVLKWSLKSPADRSAFVPLPGVQRGMGSEERWLRRAGEPAVLLRFPGPTGNIPIHTMFPSATFCLWISKRSDRCVNSHRAKNCPRIIQLCMLKSASCSSINLWTWKKCRFNPPFASRCTVAWGHSGLISHRCGQTDPLFAH